MEKKKDLLGKDYICPQCGPDSNGSEIHSYMFHLYPPLSLEEAKKLSQNTLDKR